MTRLTSNPFEAAKIEAREALASTVTRARAAVLRALGGAIGPADAGPDR